MTAVVTLALVLSLGPPQSTSAAPPAPSATPMGTAPATVPPAAAPDPDPVATVDRAAALLSGRGIRARGTTSGSTSRTDATLAMRDLYRARTRLGFFDGLRAQTLLARPTQGKYDPGGDGYKTKATRRCSAKLCVHSVRKGRDKTRPGWAARTLRLLDRVWQFEIGRLGYAAPPHDGERGGDGRFDVYLTDLGSRGLFGYCTPEGRVKGKRFQASGYCVLDNDFAAKQYGARPLTSLRVTASHEFFHAIQFGYDFYEDPWLMESTAVWMEEQFADGANDNRRFLGYGTVKHPGISLDRFSNTGYAHYGNWAFWEYLTDRYSDFLVRRVWRRAGTRVGDNEYSLQALQGVLADRGGVRAALAAYASANLTPRLSYAEGGHWPRPLIRDRAVLGPADRRAGTSFRLDHLAARHFEVRPGRKANGKRWRLSVRVNGPLPRTDPAVRILVRRKNGDVRRKVVRLDRNGNGRLTVRFNHRTVTSVTVTVVNASTRFACNKTTLNACGGVPRDNRRPFEIKVRAFRTSR